MRQNKTMIWIITNIMMVIILGFFSNASADDVVIITNKSAPDSALEKKEIKKIYSGHKTKWSNNEAIILTILKDSDLHQKFLKEYVQKTPSQFQRTWRKMVFTGKGRQPIEMESLEKMIEFVSNTKGAIGYIPSDASSEKVIIIRGK